MTLEELWKAKFHTLLMEEVPDYTTAQLLLSLLHLISKCSNINVFQDIPLCDGQVLHPALSINSFKHFCVTYFQMTSFSNTTLKGNFHQVQLCDTEAMTKVLVLSPQESILLRFRHASLVYALLP